MTREPAWLLDFKSDAFSQSGEDGIIEKILQLLPHQDKWCVEFGAWDGMFLSNSRNLIENAGYSSVLIEGSKEKWSELKNNYCDNKKVITLNAFVGFGKTDSLDVILADTPVPLDFDFLSIDVDGNDYHIWNAIEDFHPKVICIEFNPTIPTEVRFVQRADPSVNQGAGLLSLVELGKEKGYELVSVTLFNAFFVDSKYFPLLGICNNKPETLRTELSGITHIFSGYDGTMFLHGNKKLLWHHGLPMEGSDIQRLPKFLRKFPGNYSFIEKIAFLVFSLFSSPKWFFGRVSQRMTRRIRSE